MKNRRKTTTPTVTEIKKNGNISALTKEMPKKKTHIDPIEKRIIASKSNDKTTSGKTSRL